jgi:serine/threonine protein kinase
MILTNCSKFSSKFWNLIYLILRILGTPSQEVWADVKTLPHYKDSFPKFNGKSLEEIMPNLDPNGIHLLTKMLCYDPNKRITAKQALLHVN